MFRPSLDHLQALKENRSKINLGSVFFEGLKMTQRRSKHVALTIHYFNPLNAESNPICHLLALLGGATIVVVSRLRVNVYEINCCVLY